MISGKMHYAKYCNISNDAEDSIITMHAVFYLYKCYFYYAHELCIQYCFMNIIIELIMLYIVRSFQPEL